MRTVTFSNPEVARALNDRFVCTWVNREPGFHNCDNSAERRIIEYECFATKNFCTFFATPELDMLHYASGHYSPEMFLKELEFVGKLKGAVLDLRNRYMEDALPEFKELHESHAKLHGLEDERLRDAVPARKGHEQIIWDVRHSHHSEGLRHLAAVHLDLVRKAAKADGPVPLDAVFRDYLFGNPFQESKGSDRPPRNPKSPGMQ